MLDKCLTSAKQASYHTGRIALRIVERFNTRLYMRGYNALLKMRGVRLLGEPRYISTKVRFDGFKLIQLSERVVVSENVIFLTHDYSLTTGLIAIGREPMTDVSFVKPITIGRNVFIGMSSVLLPGTKVGDNVIIGAGSVVRGVVPENSIVMGNPATVVGRLSDKAECWAETMKKDFETVHVDA